MNVLAIGAHFDDVELGCGGAIARHVKNGDKVFIFIATNSQYSNKSGNIVRASEIAKQEGIKSAEILGASLYFGNIETFALEFNETINVQLVKMIEEKQIDTIYTHWIYDVHHDHRNLALATLHAGRHVNRILMYKSNWYMSEGSFQKNFYVDISETWDIKEQVIRTYKSELDRVGNTWLDYFKREAQNNGLQLGVQYAEGFQIVKWLW